jgi:hypothetical protein
MSANAENPTKNFQSFFEFRFLIFDFGLGIKKPEDLARSGFARELGG